MARKGYLNLESSLGHLHEQITCHNKWWHYHFVGLTYHDYVIFTPMNPLIHSLFTFRKQKSVPPLVTIPPNKEAVKY